MTQQQYDQDALIKLLSNYFKKLQKSPVSLFVVAILFVIISFFGSFFIYVKPNEFAVKQIKIGVNRGIQDKVYNTGYHFVLPVIQDLHVYPKDIQVFDLTRNPSNSATRFRDSSARIQTSDGFYVDADVSVFFRIDDPVKVINTIGVGELFFASAILPKTEPVLKETLGKLTTEEFYNPFKRVEKMVLAKERLNEELNEKGIVVDEVFVRYFKYSSEIQRNIEEKKLKDQLVFKNQAEARAAQQQAQLSKIIEEGEAKIKVELEYGEAYKVEKDAAAELYVRTKKANANLLVKRAEATKTKLINRAYMGQGAENLVGLEMAEVLKGIEMIVLPSDGQDGMNPLNLEATRVLFD